MHNFLSIFGKYLLDTENPGQDKLRQYELNGIILNMRKIEQNTSKASHRKFYRRSFNVDSCYHIVSSWKDNQNGKYKHKQTWTRLLILDNPLKR